MFRFASPIFLLLLPVIALAAWWVYRRRAATGLLFPGAGRCVADGPGWRTRVAQWLPALTLLGLGLAVIALARPQTVLGRVRRTADVIAIQMVVDVSGSMQALDMSDIVNNRIVTARTRLDVVKDTFAAFIEQRPDDLIGLITFGGFASTRCPLTTDHDALRHILAGVQIPQPFQDDAGRITNQEELLTAIGDALATACARLRDIEIESRIAVLLSDGESNTGIVQPDIAIRAARQLGIKVYTIGIGTTGNAPFRVRDMFGREGIQFDHVRLDETLLKSIADETGGRYFNALNPEGLAEALAAIDTLEKTTVERQVYEHFDERFPWFLIPGVALIVVGIGLNMAIAGRLI